MLINQSIRDLIQ